MQTHGQLACTALVRRTREVLAANAPELPPERRDVEDGRMHELLLVAFGPQVPEKTAEEADDKAFYADVIKASLVSLLTRHDTSWILATFFFCVYA